MDDLMYNSAASAMLYIGNLEQQITATLLRQHFSSFGEIIELAVIRKQRDMEVTTTHALCQFFDTLSAVNALKHMDGKVISGNRLMLGFRKLAPTNYIRIGIIASGVTAAGLYLHCLQFGRVTRVAINRAMALAIVNFKDTTSSQRAVQELRGATMHGQRLDVDYATPAWQRIYQERFATENADTETCTPRDAPIQRIQIVDGKSTPIEVTSSSYDDHNYTSVRRCSCTYDTDSAAELDEIADDELVELISICDENDGDNIDESRESYDSESSMSFASTASPTLFRTLPSTQNASDSTCETLNRVTKRSRRQDRAKKITGPRPFICPHCPASFKGQGQVSNHINYIHAGKTKQLENRKPPSITVRPVPEQHFCQWCPYWTYQKGSLSLHNKRIHSDMLNKSEPLEPQPTTLTQQPNLAVVRSATVITPTKHMNQKSPVDSTVGCDELIVYSPAPSSQNRDQLSPTNSNSSVYPFEEFICKVEDCE